MKKVEWNTVRAQLPVVAPSTEQVRVKNTIFNALTNKLEQCEGDWTDKSELFASLFTDIVPAAAMQATFAITDMDSYSTDVFTFNDMELLDSNFRVLETGHPNAADYPPATRNNVRYFKFTLTVSPREIDPGDLSNDVQLFPTPATTTVYVRAFREQDQLHPQITKQLLDQNLKLLLTIYELNHCDFTLAQKTHYEAAPNPDTQRKWHTQIKAKTKFAAMRQLIQTLYVGRMEGTESMAQRILRIKQRTWNPETQRARFKSIMELGAEFQYILNEVTPATDPDDIPNLEHAIYQALSQDLQTNLVDALHPQPPVSIRQNMAQFTEFLLAATTEEKSLRTIAMIAERTVSRQSRQSYQQRSPARGPRTFMASMGKQTPEETYNAYLHQQQQRQHQHQHTPIAAAHPIEAENVTPVTLPFAFICTPHSQCTQEQQEMMTVAITTMDDLVESLTFVSIVEEALVKSSGMNAPLKCFGCNGIPEYTQNCFHLWRNCPNKNDKRVWNNFQQNLATWRETRKLQPRNNNSYQANWKNQGYPNQSVQERIHSIANPTTMATTRKVLLATLATELDPKNDDEASVRKGKRKPKDISTGGNPRHFLCYMQKQLATPKTFLGAPPLMRYPFKIAYKLPFMTFPIGDGATSNDRATLSGLADTGGCCNMGSLQYHSEILKTFPQLVAEFTELAEKRFESISIGGLQGGVILTHMIRYHIPYTDRGEALSLTLGLTADFPLDTLFGVGFQIEAKMTIDLAARKVYSGLFQDSYTLEFKEPTRTNPAHIVSQLNRTPKAMIAQKEE
jgi:hypothetical protein